GGLLDEYARCDLTDSEQVSKLPIDNIDSMINLAGLAKVGDSFKDAEKYKLVNVAVVYVQDERLVREKKQTRVIAISTGALYDPNQALPLTEESTITRQGSPYALSKALMEDTASKLREQGLDAVVVRPFN